MSRHNVETQVITKSNTAVILSETREIISTHCNCSGLQIIEGPDMFLSEVKCSTNVMK